MKLQLIDWIFVLGYFSLALFIGLLYSKRAGRSISAFFISGRNLPWWLAGTSMVATTFAADTPLAVTGLVSKHGIAGNWLWWNMVMSGMLTAFIYARLWRRAGVLTDVEFVEHRYSGRPAAILRGFRALYLALPINCIIMGWVTLAMVKILRIALNIGKWEALGICLLVTVVYSSLSGLWGVVITDFFQFIIAMGGSIVLTFFSLSAVGGMTGLKARLEETFGSTTQILSFTPDIGSPWMPVTTFLVYVGINWWAAWYPGAEPGGGGYIAQRIFSAKNEKHSLLGTLWFNVAHYALRPWPWIIVALASMVLYPDLADKETGYVRMWVDYLPSGFAGLMMVAFAAAFMSTISTHLNWGSSYIVNDFYRRFVIKGAPERHYVLVSRLTTWGLMILAGITALLMRSIEGAWKFLLALGAGTGSVYLLRWFWWRINAWSEISAMVASFIASSLLQTIFGFDASKPLDFAWIMIITVAFSTTSWVTVTFLTRPEPEEKLIQFYKKINPGGKLWGPVAEKAGGYPDGKISRGLLDWMVGCLTVYLSLFGIGKIIFEEYAMGTAFLLIAVGAWFFIYQDLSK